MAGASAGGVRVRVAPLVDGKAFVAAGRQGGHLVGRAMDDGTRNAGDRAGKRMGSRFSAAFKSKLKIGATLGAGLAIAGGVSLFKSAIKGASDLNETMNKGRVIFGRNFADMDRWSSRAATSMGLSRKAAIEAASGFGDMFSQLGFSGGQAAKMSRRVVQLSADLGSFNNLPTGEVTEMMSAAFRGEYDSLQRVIPNINAARVETEALAKTGKTNASQLTAQEKAAATLAIVQKDGARAAGDFARTSGSASNQQKILSARMENLRDKLGTKLLPVWTGFLGLLNSKAIPALQAVGAWATRLWQEHLKPALTSLWATARPVLVDFGQALIQFWNRDAKPALSALWTFTKVNLIPLLGFLWHNVVVPAFKGIAKAISVAWSIIRPTIRALWAILNNVLIPVIRFLWANVVRPIFGFIGALIKLWWNHWVKPVFTALKFYFNNVLFPVIRFLWNHVVRPIFNSIGSLIKTWWSKGVKPTFVALKWYFNNVLFPVVRFLWRNVVKPVFDKVGSGIRWSWEHVIRPVFNALKNFIGDKVVPAFKSGVEKVKTWWDKLKGWAKAPVNFVIGTVYNNGIRKLVNKIAGHQVLGPVEKLASGGVLPGYTPGRDVHHFLSNTGVRLDLSGGEAIMRPEFTKAVGGPRGVKRLNALARRGMRFAKGGVVWPLPGSTPSTYAGHDGVDLNAPNDYGKPYYSATSGKVSYVGWNRGYGDAVFVRSPYGELVYGHSSATFVKAGQSVRPGSLLGLVGSTGHSSGPHLHFGFPGGTYAQALALLNGSGGKLPGGLIGQVATITAGGAAQVAEKVRKKGASLLGKLGDSPFAQMALGAGRKLVDVVADKTVGLVKGAALPKAGATAGAGLFGNLGKNIGHLLGLGGYRNGGVLGSAHSGIYDTGGHLPTGLSSVFNGTGRPEQILTSQQWADIHALAMRSIEGQRQGVEVHQHFPTSSESAMHAAAQRMNAVLGV